MGVTILRGDSYGGELSRIRLSRTSPDTDYHYSEAKSLHQGVCIHTPCLTVASAEVEMLVLNTTVHSGTWRGLREAEGLWT